MPKPMTFTRGSIVYFEGDKDDRVYILQKGLITLTSVDVETNTPVTENIKAGEFFGVKSALGHFPREETATALYESVCITMSVTEFENVFSANKALIMKMLRVFSFQLRHIHHQIEGILRKGAEPVNLPEGMYSVIKAFESENRWQSCADVCKTYLLSFPNGGNKAEVAKLLTIAAARAKSEAANDSYSDSAADDGIPSFFNLPAFKRFAKTYKNGQVIITEFQHGDSFYLIQSGKVRLVKCVNGVNKNLDILKPGEFMGEMAILDNSPRSATCIASGPVECLEFNKANFEQLITGNPQLALILLKLFCKRIYDQKRRLKILVIKDPQARIADVFCMLDELNPTDKIDDKKRKFSLTSSDVAHWAGWPIQQTEDEIARFTSSHKIEVFDNYIIVNNINDMKRIVDTRSQMRQI